MRTEYSAEEVLETKSIPVAEYRRASDESQKFSTQNQSFVNHAYAAAHGMVIVRNFTDEGKSGLNVERRDALKQLIAEVESGSCHFKAILVYDVSRWGRFQDADESAHYEFICKRAGIRVHYCAEQFDNDGSPLSAIMKGMKRAMAGEYSLDLSKKVFLGQSRLVQLGYSLGASAPYGLRRMLVDQNGKPKCLMGRGDKKSIQADRIIIVPGPLAEVEIVRWIFETFAARKMRERQIASTLNWRGVRNAVGKRWTSLCIRRILTNERYIGNNVWNRTSGKLRTKRTKNHPDQWVRADGVFKAIVSREIFNKAQVVLRDGDRKLSLEEKLEPLRRLLREHGYLSAHLIDQTPGVPGCCTYHRWFGGLYPAYELVGFRPARRQPRPQRVARNTTRRRSDERLLEGLRQLLIIRGQLNEDIIDDAAELPCAQTYRKRFGSLDRAYQLIGYKKPDRRLRTKNAKLYKLTNQQLLDRLRKLLAEKGYLTKQVINLSPDVPCTSTYLYRFGSLRRIYERLGYKEGVNTPRNLREYRQSYTDEYLLEVLKKLKEKHGALSHAIIDGSRSVPSPNTYIRHFGSLSRAYERIGYAPENSCENVRTDLLPRRCPRAGSPSDREMLDALRALWQRHGRLSQKIISNSQSVPSCTLYAARFGSLTRAYALIGYRPTWYAHRPKGQVSRSADQ